jgi:hypothetical protein
MNKFAIVKNGVVENLAVADVALENNWVAADDTVAIGDLWDGHEFSKPELDYEAQWLLIRARRNSMLILSDWTQLPDAPVDAEAWSVYRQDLRDVTNQSDPFEILWPSLPEA